MRRGKYLLNKQGYFFIIIIIIIIYLQCSKVVADVERISTPVNGSVDEINHSLQMLLSDVLANMEIGILESFP
jgi:hypothetical protein